DVALVSVLVVARAPRPAGDLERERQVVDARRRREARRALVGVQRREIHERLERRARLAVGQRGAGELTGQVVPAADQRPGLSGVRLDDEHDRLQTPRRILPAQAGPAWLEAIETPRDRAFGEPL